MRLPVIPVVHENAVFCFTLSVPHGAPVLLRRHHRRRQPLVRLRASLRASFRSLVPIECERYWYLTRYWSRAARASSAGWWPFSRHSFFAKSKVRASVTLSGGNKSVLRYDGHDAQLPEEQHASCGSTHTLFLLSVQHGVVDSFPFAVEQSKPLPSGPGSKHSTFAPYYGYCPR